MKKLLGMTASCLLAGFVFGQAAAPVAATPEASEEEAWLSGGAEVALLTGYNWRGQLLNNKPVLQPDVYLSAFGFDLDIWGSIDLKDDNDTDEVDFTLSYSFDLDDFTFSFGWAYYDYPGSEGDADQPLFASVSYDALVTPTFAVWWDNFGEPDKDALYYNLSLAYSYEVAEDFSVGLSYGIGYGSTEFLRKQYDLDDGGFNDMSVKLSATWAFADCAYLSASCNWVNVVDDVRDAQKAADADHEYVIGAIAVGVEF